MADLFSNMEDSERRDSLKETLDFPNQYCIITKEKLPLYRKIFNSALEKQAGEENCSEEEVEIRHRLSRQTGFHFQLDPQAAGEGFEWGGGVEEEGNWEERVHLTLSEPPPQQVTDPLESQKNNRYVSDRSIDYGFADAKEMLAKIEFTIENIKTNIATLLKNKLMWEKERVRLVCEFARNELEHVLKEDTSSTTAKGKKGKKDKGKMGKKKKGGPEPLELPEWMDPDLVEVKTSDEYVMSKLDTFYWEMLASDRMTEELTMKINRADEKLINLETRMTELQEQKVKLLFEEKEGNIIATHLSPREPRKFLRKQSEMYRDLHSCPDPTLGVEFMEEALKEVNHHLVTDGEYQYIRRILDLPHEARSNFKLFCIMASLSERIKDLDPIVRDLIDQQNYEALECKLDWSKDIFHLMAPFDFRPGATEKEQSLILPRGTITPDQLRIELAAGGVSPENTEKLMKKFDRKRNGTVEFIDFLVYMPLFVSIHQKIKSDPLNIENN